MTNVRGNLVVGVPQIAKHDQARTPVLASTLSLKEDPVGDTNVTGVVHLIANRMAVNSSRDQAIKCSRVQRDLATC